MLAALVIVAAASFPIGMMLAAIAAAGPADRLPNHRKNPDA